MHTNVFQPTIPTIEPFLLPTNKNQLMVKFAGLELNKNNNNNNNNNN